MTTMDSETVKDLKSEKLADLLEEVLINTALDILLQVSRRYEGKALMICYRSDCPSRDNIPF
jgi:hypothetical protein